MPRALFVIAPTVFRDEEFFVPEQILRAGGIKIVVASTRAGECRGKLGGVAHADFALAEIAVSDYDAVIFVGGTGSHIFQNDPNAHRICREVVAANKVLAGICAGPTILARAGVLRGKRATCFPGEEYYAVLREGGATLTKTAVEVDGLIITADGPASAEEFGEKILELLRN